MTVADRIRQSPDEEIAVYLTTLLLSILSNMTGQTFDEITFIKECSLILQVIRQEDDLLDNQPVSKLLN